MILRLLVALTRWAWGVSPAFYVVKTPIGEGDGALMMFGLIVDVVVMVPVAVFVLPELADAVGRWWRRKGKGGAR